MNVNKTASVAAKELAVALEQIEENLIEQFMQSIVDAKKIYVAGAGRSLLMLRAFAMRLMHLGFEIYVTGDTTTPAFEEGDLMIIASASGETSGAVSISQRVKKLKGKLAVITIKADSTLGSMADICVMIPAYTDKYEDVAFKKTTLPGGSMFEQCVLLLGDTMVMPLGKKMGISTDKAFFRHANLE